VVAHEVKNPLAGIRGALEVIGGRMPEASRDRAVLRDIIGRLDSLNDTVQDLLVFARPREPRLTPVSLVHLLETTAALLKKDPAHADTHVDISGDTPVVEVDAEQLQTVFLNLLLNAAQAAGPGGRVRAEVSTDNGLCRVAIADNGPGISAEIRERIFEPFFTTKHRGTGLGLPTAKRVIERHQGTIGIDCPAEGGTIVTVILPAASRERAASVV